MPSVPTTAMTHIPSSALPTWIGEALERRFSPRSAPFTAILERSESSEPDLKSGIQVPIYPSATFDFPIAIRTSPPPRLG